MFIKLLFNCCGWKYCLIAFGVYGFLEKCEVENKYILNFYSILN